MEGAVPQTLCEPPDLAIGVGNAVTHTIFTSGRAQDINVTLDVPVVDG